MLQHLDKMAFHRVRTISRIYLPVNKLLGTGISLVFSPNTNWESAVEGTPGKRGEISGEMPVTSVETGISQEISPNEKNEKKEKKISGEICSEMPVTTEVTGISPEISPYNPAIVSEGEISSEMPVSTEETGISQEISP